MKVRKSTYARNYLWLYSRMKREARNREKRLEKHTVPKSPTLSPVQARGGATGGGTEGAVPGSDIQDRFTV